MYFARLGVDFFGEENRAAIVRDEKARDAPVSEE
jgi:hypothetical protein